MAKSGIVRGKSWPITTQKLTIGRESGCDVRIPDPVVSRQHCEIVLDGESIVLRDLGSLNPTFVNGQPVASGKLRVGDEIRIGRVVFFITCSDAGALGAEDKSDQLPADTLAEQESVYLSSQPPGEGVGVQPQTDADLNELFQLSRSLSRITSGTDLIKAVGNAVEAHFRADAVWLLLQRAEETHVTTFAAGKPAGPRMEPPPRDCMLVTLKERRGVLLPRRVARDGQTLLQCTMAAPILFGEHEVGVLALQRSSGERTYHKRDLHFLVALSHIVAPFFKAIERIEQLETENRRLCLASDKVTRLVGSSKALAKVQRMIMTVAPTLQPVLILGATGTGKEVVAVLIHELSERSEGPMVTVNCAAIPRELFESEFFGHEKGAFTGALMRKIGLLEQSHNGTLFLDEIGDLSLEHQARILRAVETRRFRRVGGQEEIGADFRVIAATNKDLPLEVQQGRFREDLYHRLKAVEIRIPPLAERRSDIPELAQHFLEMANAQGKGPRKRLSPTALEYLLALSWPGNVRELKYSIEVACALCKDEVIDVEDLCPVCDASQTGHAPLPLADVERLHILKALEYSEGNMVETARLLGIGRSTLYNKLTQYGLKSRSDAHNGEAYTS